MNNDDSTIDPYYEFDQWCRRNGFIDVSDATPEEVDLDRLNEAVVAYGNRQMP